MTRVGLKNKNPFPTTIVRTHKHDAFVLFFKTLNDIQIFKGVTRLHGLQGNIH